jgi:hypothetical protein
VQVKAQAIANTAPRISGSPPASVVAGQSYSFTPTASDQDADALTFSITNRPTWAAFNSSTGRLSATPTANHVGTYANIVISVSDGHLAHSLPAFTISVSASGGGTPINSPPSISGAPATSAAQGRAYTFTPSASDADGDVLSFSITNAPRWASFNTSTGGLYGTPSATDVGSYTGIVITVSDGQTTRSLAAFSISVNPITTTGSATLSWTPPTQNTDGSPLRDLRGYRIYWGGSSGSYSNSVSVNNPGLATYVVEGLTSGRWYFAVAAINTAGAESRLSNQASKTIP